MLIGSNLYECYKEKGATLCPTNRTIIIPYKCYIVNSFAKVPCGFINILPSHPYCSTLFLPCQVLLEYFFKFVQLYIKPTHLTVDIDLISS